MNLAPNILSFRIFYWLDFLALSFYQNVQKPAFKNLLCTWSRTAVKYVMAWPNIQHDDRQQAGQVHAVVIVAAHIRVSLGCFQSQVGGTRRESPDVER